MNSTINDVEKKILFELIKANRRLDSFTLFKRLKLGFGVFTQNLNSLSERDFISIDGMAVILSLQGLEFCRKINFSTRGSPKVIQLNPRFTRTQLPVDEFYIPTIRRLDKKTFHFPDK